MLSRFDIQDLPKVELHCHLEGALRLSTIIELCDQLGVEVPGITHATESGVSTPVEPVTPAIACTSRKGMQEHHVLKDIEAYRRMFCSPHKVESLFVFIEKFWNVQSLLCSVEIIERISYEACIDAYDNGVRLLELRYSPSFIAASHYRDHSHLTYESIHAAVVAGIRRAEEEVDIAVGLIGILDRSNSVEDEESVMNFFLSHSEDYVGVDIANDERYSCIPFAPLFQRAAEKGLGLTCHAGEATNAESVRDAVNFLNVTRIGHGFRAINDETVVDLLIERDVILEICPVSNLLTGSVESMKAHPIRRLMTKGVKVSVNSDDPGIFDTNIIDDYAQLVEHQHFTTEEFLRCNRYAAEKSFLPRHKIDRVIQQYFS